MSLKDILQKTGVLNNPDKDAKDGRPKGPIPPPAPPTVMPTYTSTGLSSGQVDSGMLERLRSDVDRAATPAFHAFRDKLKAMDSVRSMTDAQRVEAAIAACGFPKAEILQGVQNRGAELERQMQKFNDDVAQARTNQLNSKDDAIKQLDERVADRRKQADSQIMMLQKQIDQVKAAAESDVQGLTVQRTTLQAERATLEQQLTTQVGAFTATAAQLRSEIATQTAQYSAALGS